ncbi:hypothetical protein Tco_0149034 [Tanacetum coccineum]
MASPLNGDGSVSGLDDLRLRLRFLLRDGLRRPRGRGYDNVRCGRYIEMAMRGMSPTVTIHCRVGCYGSCGLFLLLRTAVCPARVFSLYGFNWHCAHKWPSRPSPLFFHLSLCIYLGAFPQRTPARTATSLRSVLRALRSLLTGLQLAVRHPWHFRDLILGPSRLLRFATSCSGMTASLGGWTDGPFGHQTFDHFGAPSSPLLWQSLRTPKHPPRTFAPHQEPRRGDRTTLSSFPLLSRALLAQYLLSSSELSPKRSGTLKVAPSPSRFGLEEQLSEKRKRVLESSERESPDGGEGWDVRKRAREWERSRLEVLAEGSLDAAWAFRLLCSAASCGRRQLHARTPPLRRGPPGVSSQKHTSRRREIMCQRRDRRRQRGMNVLRDGSARNDFLLTREDHCLWDVIAPQPITICPRSARDRVAPLWLRAASYEHLMIGYFEGPCVRCKRLERSEGEREWRRERERDLRERWERRGDSLLYEQAEREEFSGSRQDFFYFLRPLALGFADDTCCSAYHAYHGHPWRLVGRFVCVEWSTSLTTLAGTTGTIAESS